MQLYEKIWLIWQIRGFDAGYKYVFLVISKKMWISCKIIVDGDIKGNGKRPLGAMMLLAIHKSGSNRYHQFLLLLCTYHLWLTTRAVNAHIYKSFMQNPPVRAVSNGWYIIELRCPNTLYTVLDKEPLGLKVLDKIRINCSDVKKSLWEQLRQ